MLITLMDTATLIIAFNFNKAVIEWIKGLAGATWAPERKAWLVPVRHGSTLLDRYGAHVMIADEAMAAIVRADEDVGWWFIAWFLKRGHKVEVCGEEVRLVGPVADGVQPMVEARAPAIKAALESGRWPVKVTTIQSMQTGELNR